MGLGYPWSLNTTGIGGRDVWPDGCTQIYDWRDDVMVFREDVSGSCGVRAPLTNQDKDWIDRNGVRHAGITKAERDWMYDQWGRVYTAGITDVNLPATEAQIIQARAALNVSSVGQDTPPVDPPAKDIPIDDSKPTDTPGSGPWVWIAGIALLWWVTKE